MGKVQVLINGNWVDVPSSTTDDALRREGHVAQGRNLIRRTAQGSFLVPKGSLSVTDGDVFLDAPPRIKGFWGRKKKPVYKPAPVQMPQQLRMANMLHRQTRITQEVMFVAPSYRDYGGVNFDENHGYWVTIPRYPLPAKWQDYSCQLMLILPEGYPLTPPVGFYLNRRLMLRNGSSDSHIHQQGYHGAPDVQGWYWYCAYIPDNGWKPSQDPWQPDNLWSYLEMVREVLTND